MKLNDRSPRSSLELGRWPEMKQGFIGKIFLVSLAFAIMMAAELRSARGSFVAPGTPLGGGNFGTVEITDGVKVLPGPVEAGDLVLRENPAGGFDRSNWSDVVRFSNLKYKGVNFGLAFQVSDGEMGIGSIAISGNTGILTSDTLSGNAQFMTEIQVGTGTDADVTPYLLPGTTYNIHSDAPVTPDLPDVTIEIGAQIDGGKRNKIIQLNEGSNVCREGDKSFDCADFRLGGVYNPTGIQGLQVPDGGDTIFIKPDPNDPRGHTIFSLRSLIDDVDSPPEMEEMNARGDEITTGYLIASVDAVPEPSTFALLLGIGTAGLIGYSWRRRKQV